MKSTDFDQRPAYPVSTMSLEWAHESRSADQAPVLLSLTQLKGNEAEKHTMVSVTVCRSNLGAKQVFRPHLLL